MSDGTQPPQGYPQGPEGYPPPPQGPEGYPPPPQGYPAAPPPKSGGNKACLIVGIVFVVIALIAGAAALYFGALIGGGVGTIISVIDANSDMYDAEEIEMAYYEDEGKFSDDPDALVRTANTIRPTSSRRDLRGNLRSVEFVKGTPSESGQIGVTLCNVAVPEDLKTPVPTSTSTSTPTSPPASPGSDIDSGEPRPTATGSTPAPTATPTSRKKSDTGQVALLQVKYDEDKAISALLVEGEVLYRAYELVGCPSSLPPSSPWQIWFHAPDVGPTPSVSPTPTRSRGR